MVTKVQRPEGKLRSGLSLGKMRKTVLRLLRMDAGLPLSSINQEESAHAVSHADIYHNSHAETRNALLYSEMRKGQAIMELQRHPPIR